MYFLTICLLFFFLTCFLQLLQQALPQAHRGKPQNSEEFEQVDLVEGPPARKSSPQVKEESVMNCPQQ